MSEQHATLEIRINKIEDKGFPVEMSLKPPDDEYRHFPVGHLSADILKLRTRGYSPEDGGRMFDLLLNDGQLCENWFEIQGLTNRKFRIRLRFDDHPTIAPLHAVPWELMHDTTVTPARNLVAGGDTPFSRYVTGKSPGKTIKERPIKLLAAVAGPDNLDGSKWAVVETGVEEKIIIDALSDLSSGQVEIRFVDQPVTLSKIEDFFKQERFHIFHFTGHGQYHEELGTVLLLADNENKAKPENSDKIAAMFERLGDRIPQFVFLAGCRTAKRPENDPFQGLCPALIQCGVPAVLAMQENIHIPTARAFTRSFYCELFRCGQIDAACNAARSRVLTENLIGSHIPVLFSRIFQNQLLHPVQGAVFEKKDFEPETVYVRSGRFLMGSPPGEGIPPEETAQHELSLPPFRMGKYPVTVREYAAFLKHNYKKEYEPKQSGWFIEEPPEEKLDHPVTGISWKDAAAYCLWLTKETGRIYRLPTEAEWEKAARGAEGLVYPWGNEWQEDHCSVINEAGETIPVLVRTNEEKPRPCRPKGTSPWGCCDMAGTVQEWTSTVWGSEANTNSYPYPYKPDKREDMDAETYMHQVYRIYRGGRVKIASDETGRRERLRVAVRGWSSQNSKVNWRGFRVVGEV